GPFMAAFDKAMPDYDKLAGYIQGITSQSDLTSFVDILSNEGDEKQRSVEVDWLLQLSVGNEKTVRRHQTIRCPLEHQGKKWKIVSLDPLDFFAPVKER